MSRKHGWTPRVRRSQELPLLKIDRKREGQNQPILPGNPSCKKVKGIVTFHSGGISPMEQHKRHMAEVYAVFGKPRKKKG